MKLFQKAITFLALAVIIYCVCDMIGCHDGRDLAWRILEDR